MKYLLYLAFAGAMLHAQTVKYAATNGDGRCG
jgi:hypothetical protein